MSEDRLLKALVGLMRNPSIHLGDQVYEVREHEGKGWEGADVKAWSDAVKEAEAILLERGVPPWKPRASESEFDGTR